MAPYLNDTEEEGADTEEDAWAIITQRMLGVGNRPGRKTIIMLILPPLKGQHSSLDLRKYI